MTEHKYNVGDRVVTRNGEGLTGVVSDIFNPQVMYDVTFPDGKIGSGWTDQTLSPAPAQVFKPGDKVRVYLGKYYDDQIVQGIILKSWEENPDRYDFYNVSRSTTMGASTKDITLGWE